MRNASRLLVSSFLAASAGALPTAALCQARAAAPAHASSAAQARSASAVVYSSSESDFVVGKTVYLRSSKTRIGTILRFDPQHGFPRSFPRPRMKAVLIRRKDGPLDWIPVEGITRIYVVNK